MLLELGEQDAVEQDLNSKLMSLTDADNEHYEQKISHNEHDKQ